MPDFFWKIKSFYVAAVYFFSLKKLKFPSQQARNKEKIRFLCILGSFNKLLIFKEIHLRLYEYKKAFAMEGLKSYKEGLKDVI